MPKQKYDADGTHAPISGAATVESVFVAGGVMGQIDLYDAVNDATGTPFLTIAAPFPGMVVPAIPVGTGLTVKLAADTVILVVWKKPQTVGM